jgi:tetratricopeptide (TPR) repeat protein
MAYDGALVLKPGLAEAWLARGNLMSKMKRLDEALRAYAAAIALNPDVGEAFFGRGDTLYDSSVAAKRERNSLLPPSPPRRILDAPTCSQQSSYGASAAGL